MSPSIIKMFLIAAAALLPTAAMAQGSGTPDDPWISGGTSIIFAGRTLTISKIPGTDGFMRYYAVGSRPWESVKDSIVNVVIEDGVVDIVRDAFSGCAGLTSITIPDGVESIGSNAFSGCIGLTSITIPDSVTYIGQYAFSDCAGLTSVVIPNGVTYIDRNTFSGCSRLESVVIPNSVTGIGAYAFANCSSLRSVIIPGSVRQILNYAFQNCTGLESVTVLTDPGDADFPIQAWTSIFGGVIREGKNNDYINVCLLVPEALIPDYEAAAGWNGFDCIGAAAHATIKFDAQGGSAVLSQTVALNERVSEPVEPTRSHYIFKGWFTQRDGAGVRWDFGDENFTVTESMTLYAAWEFDPDGDGYIVTFGPSYEPCGTVTAAVDGNEITSGDRVGHGKSIVFTVTVDRYCIFFDEWEVNGLGFENRNSTILTLDSLSEDKAVLALVYPSMSVTSGDRAITAAPSEDAAAVMPVSHIKFRFSAGPNPVSKSAGSVEFFAGAGGNPPALANIRAISGKLTIYDAAGNVVRKINIDPGVQPAATWDLRNDRGQPVAAGSYLARGIVVVNGRRERVSVTIGVR